MNILKGFTIFAITVVWNVQPVNAQTENPCPQIENYGSYVEMDVTLYESPTINSEVIGIIPASQPFTFLSLRGYFSENVCWYELSTDNYLGQAGWVKFSVELPQEFDETVASEESDLFRYNFIVVFIVFLAIPVIVWISIKVFEFIFNTIFGVLSFFARTISTLFFGENKVSNLNNVIASNVQAIPTKKTEDNSNDIPKISEENNQKISTDLPQNQQTKPEQSEFAPSSKQQTNDNDIVDSMNVLFDDLESEFEFFDNLNLSTILQQFNAKNYQYFENQLYFIPLKPTDNVIHGLVGNLGINNEAELEVVEISQASYLSFKAEGQLWLIPNLKLSRWQQLLKNSTFFDVLGDFSNPRLVKPAQLEWVTVDRRKLAAKGIFN